MSQKEEENITIRPYSSRFTEHFDIAPPTELLDEDHEQEEEAEKEERERVYLSASDKLEKKLTPLYSLSSSRLTDSHIFHSPTPSITNSTPNLSAIKLTEKSTAPVQQYDDATQLKSDKKLRSLNRADIIIKRYESWHKFIILLISWLTEISRQSHQSERTYRLLSANSKSKKKNGTVQDIQATLHSFTIDLALQEQKFAQLIRTEHLPILENLKKECNHTIKSLKNRYDLGLEEFLRRAEVTANFIVQLKKVCKETRNTIENGSHVINDPWLANLYLLRQLKREVNEENRLRELMVPIQKTLFKFESKLLVCVENVLTICFDKPNVSNQSQYIQVIKQTVTDNWDTFISNHKKDIVDELNPLKHYLNINYPCKNDPLVMTLCKGELERKIGVLNKYSKRFFVLTQSGFLHQFKLNDKLSPEFSIYLPKCTLLQSKEEPNSFEIQRSGSVLQRDKSYVFRTDPEQLAIWFKLLSTQVLSLLKE